MADVSQLIEIPFETLVLLGAGYLGYRIAYADKDTTHTQTDTVFLSLVFAAIAKLVTLLAAMCAGWLLAGQGVSTTEVIAPVIGLVGALVAASLWRVSGETRVFRALRALNVSASDRQRNAWHTVLARPPAKGPTRLFVKCTDGARLLCNRLADFEAAPFGPCILGADGSVLMYVTHRRDRDDAPWDEDQIAGEAAADWGYELTYVPPNRVAEIRINYPLSL